MQINIIWISVINILVVTYTSAYYDNNSKCGIWGKKVGDWSWQNKLNRQITCEMFIYWLKTWFLYFLEVNITFFHWNLLVAISLRYLTMHLVAAGILQSNWLLSWQQIILFLHQNMTLEYRFSKNKILKTSWGKILNH